jgi:hypothetical protein
MTINIPQSVFNKYNEGIDTTIESFGVICQLVSLNKIEVIEPAPANNNIPEKNSINAHRVRGGDYERQNKIIKEVEVLTPIKLKVYYNPKSWINVAGNIQVPDGTIQTIGYLSDLEIILQAKALIAHTAINNIKELRYQRLGEPSTFGFKQDRYFACLWGRV